MNTTYSSTLEASLRQRQTGKSILFMSHVVVGYPSLDANWAMLEAMDDAGVDVVEFQLPFSEPIADGPRFVKANHEAIKAGPSWQQYFDLATRAAARFSFEIVLMGYYNSVFRMGPERFCARLAEAGMKGFIVPDLPVEEASELNGLAREHGLDPILTMTPTNSPARLAEIGRNASGFLYCVARTGVTGRQTDLSSEVGSFLRRCREATPLPLGLGFGIRSAENVRQAREHGADLAIVGTAGTQAWEEGGPEGYSGFLKSLAAATA
jgi:tryptophan synthase alpha chain